VARKIPVHIWGQGLQYLSPGSPLRKNFHGEAWGLEMYKILSQSKIVLNRHISVAKNYANNMRLYETTGMGALLITDDKKNLNQLFIIGKEIISYKNKDDLIKKINFFLNKKSDREKIAKRGQQRTLRDYSYNTRMMEMIELVRKYLKND
jgi:spore maturation protein CgeB